MDPAESSHKIENETSRPLPPFPISAGLVVMGLLCALCNRCQKHGALRNGVRTCHPSQCFKKGACRYHFPYAVAEQPNVLIEQENGASRKRFAAERNDPWLNQHSKVVLLGWRANIYLQPVLDRQAAIKYMSKYASKPEVISQSYRDTLGDFCNPVV